MDKKLVSILKRNHVFSLDEGIKILGNDKAVYRLVDSGLLKKISPLGLGFFCYPEQDEGVAHFAIVAKYYPQCVISGKTALAIYDLSKDYINKIDVDISNETNLSNALLIVHRVVPSKICHVIEREFKNKGIHFKIKIYSPERTLFEAYKYYKGTDSFYFALKNYNQLYLDKKNPGNQFDIILSINKKIGKEIISLLMMDKTI